MKEWSTLKKLIWLRKINGGGGGSSDPLNTFTGAIVRFLAKKAKPMVKLEANFTPIQDLNGYDAPWPPGGGKNLFNADTGSNGYIDNSGSVVARTYQFASDYIAVSAGNQYTISAASQMANIGIAYFDSSKAIILPRVDNASRQTLTITPATGVAYVRFWFYKNQSTDLNPTNVKETYKVQFEAGSSATTYAPYSNICPISGHTGCDIFDKAEYDPQATPTVTINFGQTVYSGTLTINEDGSGSIKARPYYSSYNGEALVGPWVSSMDAYVPGATPTTGAQVVDMGGTETTTQLTASQINTLVGENNVWVDAATGDITVQAYGTPIGAFSPIVGTGQAGHMII